MCPRILKKYLKNLNFKEGKAPLVGSNNALEESPPVIPHQLQMRENCLACHAGPGAPKEIRVSHPERINCRQCHVPNNKVIEHVRNFCKKFQKPMNTKPNLSLFYAFAFLRFFLFRLVKIIKKTNITVLQIKLKPKVNIIKELQSLQKNILTV